MQESDDKYQTTLKEKCLVILDLVLLSCIATMWYLAVILQYWVEAILLFFPLDIYIYSLMVKRKLSDTEVRVIFIIIACLYILCMGNPFTDDSYEMRLHKYVDTVDALHLYFGNIIDTLCDFVKKMYQAHFTLVS